MRESIRTTAVAVWLLAAALPALAATPTEFYLSLLRRGTMDVEAGEYQRAMTPLRIAAFGLVDSIEQYQTAQVHLAVAAEKLEQDNAARDAVRRVLSAQQIEARYASLRLSPAVRSAFQALAGRVRQRDELALLEPAPPAARESEPERAGTTPDRSDTAAPAPARTAPAPPASGTTAPRTEPAASSEKAAPDTAARAPATNRPASVNENVAAPAASSVPQTAPRDVESRLSEASEAIDALRLDVARSLYRSLLGDASLRRDALILVGEGLCRSRDFAGSLEAFERAGGLRGGEERYRFYVAVSLYETGAYARAKEELEAALPFVKRTPEVDLYRTRIEQAAR